MTGRMVDDGGKVGNEGVAEILVKAIMQPTLTRCGDRYWLRTDLKWRRRSGH